jgi:hypothetical protein
MLFGQYQAICGAILNMVNKCQQNICSDMHGSTTGFHISVLLILEHIYIYVYIFHCRPVEWDMCFDTVSCPDKRLNAGRNICVVTVTAILHSIHNSGLRPDCNEESMSVAFVCMSHKLARYITDSGHTEVRNCAHNFFR